MKVVILIIFFRGWAGESVAIHSVDFESMDACKSAAVKLRNQEKSKYGRFSKHSVYTCVNKGNG